MPGFHLRAAGNRRRGRIVVIAIVVPLVMKRVDEWPADVSLGDQNEIHIYSRRHTVRERSEREGKELREKEGKGRLTASKLEHPVRWPRINLLLVATLSPWFLLPCLLLIPIPVFTIQGYNPEVQPRRIIDFAQAGYIPTRTFPVGFRISMHLPFLTFSFLKRVVSRSDRKDPGNIYNATPTFLLNNVEISVPYEEFEAIMWEIIWELYMRIIHICMYVWNYDSKNFFLIN